MMTENVKQFVKAALQILDDRDLGQIITLTDGKSGAEVYRINISSRCSSESGIYIVKLIDTESMWYTKSTNEAERAAELWSQKTAFREHLVELCAEKVIDRYHVIIYRQANDSVLNTMTCDKLKISDQSRILRELSYDLLKEWNAECSVTETSEEMFDGLLNYRLNMDGNFEKKMAGLLKDKEQSAFVIKDRLYPNPYYYIRHQQEWIGKISTVRFLKGNLHSDLHRRNVMCGRENRQKERYFVIDYDAYQKDGYLFFDQAYLEMSIYFDSMESYDAEKWNELLKLLFEKGVYEEVEESVDEPLTYLRNAIYKGMVQWVSEEQPHTKDSIELQILMARIAAGINYFSKGGVQERECLIRILDYIGNSFKALFDKIQFQWNTQNITLLQSEISKEEYVDDLWENGIKYASKYVPILITDDAYNMESYKKIKKISEVKWALVIDIGKKLPPEDFSSVIGSAASEYRNVSICNLNNPDMKVEYTHNTCTWLTIKKDEQVPTYGVLWAYHQNVVSIVIRQILSQEALRPVLFVFDVKKGQAFVKKFWSCMLEHYNKIEGSRLMTLGSRILDEDEIETAKALKIRYFERCDADLGNVAETIQCYMPALAEKGHSTEVVFPTISTIRPEPLTEKEINYYESSVELVYAGVEGKDENTNFGEAFYRGEEITWSDLANNCDFRLINSYEKKRDLLLKTINEDSPRVKTLKLIHGAGTGGTTLSKRLLWDLKEQVPCVRLKKYTQDTANILLEIYHNTGKRVLMAVEMGATILDGEDLTNLLSRVNESNGKLMVLQIERNSKEVGRDTPFIKIQDTMQDNIARNFELQFGRMTNDEERRHLIHEITEGLVKEWQEQRCPFFYGFYTFQDKYHLNNIKRTVEECDQIMKNLLSDLAIVTIYSQNICIRYSELPARLGNVKKDVEEWREKAPYLLYDEIDPSIKKIIVLHENGYRFCHPLIAKKVLCELYGVKDYEDGVYNASLEFITRFHDLYGSEDEVADKVLKELFVDRAYIDSMRTRFSSLIEEIPEHTKRKKLFEKLIELYPENPHYYNHLARLLVESSASEYKEAIRLLDKAIDIARDQEMNTTVHYITLGCIYCKQIYAYIKEQKTFQKEGRFADSIEVLMQEIGEKYLLADQTFKKARLSSAKNSSYTYYPQIQMECVLIQRIVEYDRDRRPMGQIYRDNEKFRTWYREHYSIAVQLFTSMQRHCETYDKSYQEYLVKAKGLVESVELETVDIQRRLTMWNGQEGSVATFYRRTYASCAYAQGGYDWNNLSGKLLSTIAKSMHMNVLQSVRQNVRQGDIYYWYEAYRRLPEFDAGEVIRLVEDYMEDSYEKEYLLYVMHFLKLEQQLSSSAEVVKHIKRCKDMVPAGINNITSRDVYSNRETGSPVVSYSDVKHDRNGRMTGLREFFGAITQIKGSTAGTIQIDGMNLTVTFTPSIMDESGRKREFTSDNVNDRVKFNLMFSYSGLRAWNVDLV